MEKRRIEIIGMLLIFLSIFVLVSLLGFNPREEPTISPNVRIGNPMGILGVIISYYFIKIGFGYISLMIPLTGLLWGWWIFSGKLIKSLLRGTGYGLGAVLLISISLGDWFLLVPGSNSGYLWSGLTGTLIAQLLIDFLGKIGSVIILLTAWVLLFRGYFDWSFYAPIEWIVKWFNQWKDNRSEMKQKRLEEKAKREHTEKLLSKIDAQQEDVSVPQSEAETSEELMQEVLPLDEKEESAPDELDLEESDGDISDIMQEEQPSALEQGDQINVGEMVVEDEVELDNLKDRKVPKREYKLPVTDLLNDPIINENTMSRDELLERANFLTSSLATFGVEGKVVNVHPGPIITLFEVEPAEGVRVNKFVALSDDLARVMEASRVRVIAPIPGRSSVGIEIPNQDPATVYFKSVINSEKFVNAKSKLTLAIGKNTFGEIATLDLASMPHVLIAGTTGSGKSVCLNTVICSIIYRATPEEVKFMIIDPKKVEMTLYRSLRKYHLITTEDIDEPIVTSTDNAILALRALEKEMDTRYTTLAAVLVRNIDEYNKKMKKEGEPIMPYIVLVIDELADLMMLSAKDVEAPIARLAQLSRAVGIHLVVATQRPSVDVITGVIKANFPARIAFQVATRIDSRTILDSIGAEKLIGRGDLLYQAPGSSEPVRLHNAFLTLEEIENIMEYIESQPEYGETKLASVRDMQTGVSVTNGGDSTDELLMEAIKLVVTHQQGSISLLQRRLKVGYSRAARLIDEMEQISVVGPFTGSKAREVLVDESYLLSIE